MTKTFQEISLAIKKIKQSSQSQHVGIKVVLSELNERIEEIRIQLEQSAIIKNESKSSVVKDITTKKPKEPEDAKN